jgi:hypothetical protein
MLLLTTLLTACGSNTRAAFAPSAKRICTVYYNRAYALPPPIGLKQLEAYPGKQQALREQLLSGLKGLTPPSSRRKAYARYLSEMATFNRLWASAIAELTRHPTIAQGLARRAEVLKTTLDSQARTLGLTKCAANPYSATHYSNS